MIYEHGKYGHAPTSMPHQALMRIGQRLRQLYAEQGDEPIPQNLSVLLKELNQQTSATGNKNNER
jgi:hypothetical protein